MARSPSQVCALLHTLLWLNQYPSGVGCRLLLLLSIVFFGSGEKRKIPETLTLEDAKRIRVMGDIPMELVNEVMMTITDPAAMLGPEVIHEGAGGLYVV